MTDRKITGDFEQDTGSYFKVYRSIFDNGLWSSDPAILKLFIWLVGKARWSHTPKKYPGGLEIGRGQLLTSFSKIADGNEYVHREKLKTWSKSQISDWLKVLTSSKRISTSSNGLGTVVTIINYHLYQPSEIEVGNASGTPRERLGNASGTRNNINNVCKKDKKEEKRGGIKLESTSNCESLPANVDPKSQNQYEKTNPPPVLTNTPPTLSQGTHIEKKNEQKKIEEQRSRETSKSSGQPKADENTQLKTELTVETPASPVAETGLCGSEALTPMRLWRKYFKFMAPLTEAEVEGISELAKYPDQLLERTFKKALSQYRTDPKNKPNEKTLDLWAKVICNNCQTVDYNNGKPQLCPPDKCIIHPVPVSGLTHRPDGSTGESGKNKTEGK
jgi:hypothetical protein